MLNYKNKYLVKIQVCLKNRDQAHLYQVIKEIG